MGSGARPQSDSEALELEAAVSAHVLGATHDPGLEILLAMAQRGEFDPWNVDIVALTDRYLVAFDKSVNERKEAGTADKLDARDLGRVARLIFYAAALIHLKAQALAEREARLAEERRQAELLAAGLDLTGELLGEDGSRLRPDDLPLLYPDFMGEDRAGMPLAPRDRPPRNRGLTLIDLIVALRSYDERLVEREALLAEMPVFDGAMALDECIGSAHEDDLDRDIALVRLELWERLPEGGRLELEQLTGPQRTRAAAYLALLFLSHDEEVVLEQAQFYGPLFVLRGPCFGQVRAGVRAPEEVAAVAPAAEEEPVAPADEEVAAGELDEELEGEPGDELEDELEGELEGDDEHTDPADLAPSAEEELA